MVTLEEQEQQVQQARQQLETQKAQVAQAEQQQQQATEQLQTAKKKIPAFTSQRALRQTMSGLGGRVKRRFFAGKKEEIEKREGEVAEYGTKLQQAKGELGTYETQVSSAEQEIADIKQAKRIISQGQEKAGLYVLYGENDRVKGYVQDYLEGVESIRQLNARVAAGDIPTQLQSSINILESKGYSDIDIARITGFSNNLPKVEITSTRNERVEIEGQMFPQLYKDTGKDLNITTKEPTYFVEGVLAKFGKGIEIGLSTIPGLSKKGTYEYSYPYQTKGTSLYSPTKGFYVEKEIIEVPSVAETGGQLASVAPYFVPYLGEALLVVGGTEKVFKAPTITGKVLGGVEVGLGSLSTFSRLKNLKNIKNIRNAQTEFISEVIPTKKGQGIRTIIETKIGKDKYLGIVKQGTMDIPNQPTLKIGATRGLIIKGTKEVVPITIIEPRIQPYKDLFLAKQAGETTKITERLVGNIKKPLIDWIPMKVKTPAGEGVYATSRIKNIEGGLTSAKVVGGYFPIKNSEKLFGFIGGDKPKLVKKLVPTGITKVIRTKPNIKGIIKQTATEVDFIGGGKALKTVTIDKFTAERIVENVIQQRTMAIDLAKAKIIKPSNIGGISIALNIPKTSLDNGNQLFSRLDARDINGDINRAPSITGSAISDFAKGISERERVTAFIKADIPETLVPTPTIKTKEVKISPKERTRESQGIISTPSIKTSSIEIIKFKPRTKQESFSTSALAVRELSTVTPSLKVKLETRLEKAQKTQGKAKTNLSIKNKPKVQGTFPIPSFRGGTKISIPTKIKVKDLIQVFARRRGKDILIGEAQTAKEAGQFLSGKLKSTLAASGFAQLKGGNKLTLSELGLGGREFGTAKRDSLRVVQRRGFRLGSFSERKEIKQARKVRGSRIKIW